MTEPRLTLVFFAVPEEARPFRRALGDAADEVRVCVTGMGRANARAAALAELDDALPSLVLSCGFAGGLNPDLACGTVVAEMDGEFPLGAALRRAGAVSGRFHCADRVLLTPAEKTDAWRLHGDDAVELESGEIRSLCRARGIPSATVRVISDAAGEALPLDFNRLYDARGELSYPRLAGALLWAPGKVLALARFGRQSTQAAARLARVLAAVLADR